MVFGTIMGAIFGSDIFGSDLCSFLAHLIFTLYSFDLVHTWSNAKKCKHNLRKLPYRDFQKNQGGYIIMKHIYTNIDYDLKPHNHIFSFVYRTSRSETKSIGQ